MASPTQLVSTLGASGLSAQTLLLGVAVLLLLAGSRHYRLALVLPAAALGALLVDTVLGAAVPADLRLLAAVVGAVSAGTLAAMLESIAVRLAGVLLGGGLVLAIWPAVTAGGPPAPWWLALVGGLVGLFMFPGLYRAALRLVVPLLGGLLLAHAIGRPGDLLWVLGSAVASFLLDTLLLDRSGD